MPLNELLHRQPLSWHGVKLNAPDWSHQSHTLAATVPLLGYRLMLHLIVNAYWEPLQFEIPALGAPQFWRRCVDTYFRCAGRHSGLGRFTEVTGLNLPGTATRCGNSTRQDRARESFLVCNSVPRRSHRSACARSSLAAARRSKRTRAAKKWVAAASQCLKWVLVV
jgi:hypothetical protein